MAYVPTEVQQGSAKEFRDAINENFENIQQALSYDPGGQQQPISIQTAIDRVNNEIEEIHEEIGEKPLGYDTTIREDIQSLSTTTNTRLTSLEGKVGQEAQQGDPATGLTLDVRTLQATVGNNSGGLVKQFNDLNKIDLYDPSQVTGRTIKFYLTDLLDT